MRGDKIGIVITIHISNSGKPGLNGAQSHCLWFKVPQSITQEDRHTATRRASAAGNNVEHAIVIDIANREWVGLRLDSKGRIRRRCKFSLTIIEGNSNVVVFIVRCNEVK